jgi:NAD(P)-dependent dehydrogenase (short-subunit alcohol dehydrogenase family)
VRQGTRHVAERGSFTLIAGVLNRDPIVTGSAAAMVNGAVESFVRAAAIEIAPQRINAVSPTVFTESMAEYGDLFPGVTPVGVDVAGCGLCPVHRGCRDGPGLPRAVR